MTKTIKIINKSPNKLPEYATKGSAGMDLRAWCSNDNFMGDKAEWDEILKCIHIFPGGRALIHTGLYISIPEGFEARIQSRSGLAINKGIFVLNSPGCIDSDYRGEIGIILYNTSEEIFSVSTGDRVAQMIISQAFQFPFKEVESLAGTSRNSGGFGHTGIK